MVVFEVITAESGDGVQLVVLGLGESAAGGYTGAVEGVVGIVHLVTAEDGFQAAFVEGFVVGHQRQTLNEWLYLPPYLWEYWGFFSIVTGETMHLAAPVVVVVGLRLYQRVEPVGNLTVSDYHHANGAYTGPLVVGRLKVDCSKVLHIRSCLYEKRMRTLAHPLFDWVVMTWLSRAEPACCRNRARR